MGKECFKCGTEMRPHYSAYQPWDEEIMVLWKPASDDNDHIEETDSGGKHPHTTTRRFCSLECLEAFVSMDYSLKTEGADG
jgi:hypothetical protein